MLAAGSRRSSLRAPPHAPAKTARARGAIARYALGRMTHKALSEILTKYGDARQTGGQVEIPPRSEVTLYAALGEESLVIDRVRSVDLEAEYLVATTSRSERFIVLYEDVRAVRIGASSAGQAGYDR